MIWSSRRSSRSVQNISDRFTFLAAHDEDAVGATSPDLFEVHDAGLVADGFPRNEVLTVPVYSPAPSIQILPGIHGQGGSTPPALNGIRQMAGERGGFPAAFPACFPSSVPSMP
jgi:hypothetical protein